MTQLTRSIKAKEVKKDWVLIDAANVRLGQLASKVAALLMGKNKVARADYLDAGDNVVIINATKIDINQTSRDKKQYYWHSGFVGGLKSRSIVELLEKKPQYVVREAVWGMLPKNRMGKKMLKHVYIFAGEEHDMQAQNPTLLKLKLNNS